MPGQRWWSAPPPRGLSPINKALDSLLSQSITLPPAPLSLSPQSFSCNCIPPLRCVTSHGSLPPLSHLNWTDLKLWRTCGSSIQRGVDAPWKRGLVSSLTVILETWSVLAWVTAVNNKRHKDLGALVAAYKQTKEILVTNTLWTKYQRVTNIVWKLKSSSENKSNIMNLWSFVRKCLAGLSSENPEIMIKGIQGWWQYTYHKNTMLCCLREAAIIIQAISSQRDTDGPL